MDHGPELKHSSHHHCIQFFENDESLVTTVGCFIRSAFDEGAAVIIIAKTFHLTALEKIAAEKIDLGELQSSKQIALVDASFALRSFMANGQPHLEKFELVIGGLIREKLANFPKLYVYSEMVGLLWESGNSTAMMMLETLWNQIIKKHHFNLICGHSLNSFRDEDDRQAFLDVCRASPLAQKFLDEETLEGQRRAIILLQQQAAALESELKKRKQAEAALREVQEFKNLILDTSPDCIKIIGLDRKLRFMSKGGLRSIELDDFLTISGTDYASFWKGEDREAAILAFEGAKNGQVMEFVGYCPTIKNQTPKWWHVVMSPIRNTDDSITGLLAISRDITDRKKAEEEAKEKDEERARAQTLLNATILEQVQESERVLDQIFLEAPSFMALLSVPGYRYLKSNSQYLKLTGEKEIIGKTVQEVEPEMETTKVTAVLDHVVQSGKPFIGKESLVHYKSKEVGDSRVAYLDFIYQPLRRQDGEIYAIAIQGHDVTEKVLSRRSVENERENLGNLFKQTPEVLCLLKGPQHLFEFVNEAHVRVLGFNATGMTVREAQPESVQVHGILDDVYRTGKTAELFELSVTIGESLRYFNLTYAARKDDTGKINGVMLLGAEVTEQVLLREKLKNSTDQLEQAVKQRTVELTKSQEFLDSVIENLPNMVFVKDAKDLRFVRFNKAGEDLLGFSRTELIGKNDYDFFSKEEADHFVNKDREVLQGRTVLDIPHENIGTKNNGSRVLHTRKIPILGLDGTPEYLLGISEDITERIKAEEERLNTIREQAAIEERRRENERIAFLAEASTVLASSLDYHKTFNDMARLAVPMIADWCTVTIVKKDRTKERIAIVHNDSKKRPLIEELSTFYPSNADDPNSGIGYVLTSGRSLFTVRVEDTDLVLSAKSPRHLEIMRALGCSSCMVIPIFSRGQTLGAISFVSAKEERIYNENDLALAEELGRRAGIAIDNAFHYEAAQEAIRARDEFMSIASHELKTPLTSLKLQSQMRHRDLIKGNLNRFSPERLPDLIENDDKQLNRLIRLVDDMLDISRIQTGKLSLSEEEFDLCELVRETVDRFTPQLEDLGCSVICDLPCVSVGRWDRFRMEQVFINLLSNAMKYGAGQPITVSVECNNKRARISVSDKGMGIAQKDRERIFGQFERAVSVNSISGLGIGLYISKKIVESHGGTISVESELGKGSIFTVDVPLHFIGSPASLPQPFAPFETGFKN